MTTTLITGANRGIGLALTSACLQAGHQVIAAVRDVQAATALAELATQYPRQLQMQPLVITEGESVAALAKQLRQRPIDVLVNNAGTMGGSQQSLANMDYDAWADAFAVNTIAPFRLATALMPNLRLGERPRIVTISSQMGSLERRSVGSYAYRSSKAAVNKVMQVMAEEVRADGVIAVPVHPGWVRTDMGGPSADISVADSASGLLALIERLTMADTGRFWTWAGEEHPW